MKPSDDITTGTTRRKRRRGKAKTVIRFLGWAALAHLLIAIALIFMVLRLLQRPETANLIIKTVTPQLDCDIHVGDVDLTLFSTFPHASLHLDDVDITSRQHFDDGYSHLIRHGTIDATVNLSRLLRDTINVERIALSNTALRIIKTPDGRANYDIVRTVHGHRPSVVVTLADISIDSVSAAIRLPAFDGATLDLHGSLAVNLADYPNVKVSRLDLSTPGAHIKASGECDFSDSDPLIKSHIDASVVAEELPRAIASLIPGNVTGTLDLDLATSLRTSDLSLTGFSRIAADGVVRVSNPMIFFPGQALAINGDHLTITLGDGIASKHATHRPLHAHIAVDSCSMTLGKFGLALKGCGVDIASVDSIALSSQTLVAPLTAALKGKEVDVRLTSGGILSYVNPTLNASLTGDKPIIAAKLRCDTFGFAIHHTDLRLAHGRGTLTADFTPDRHGGAKLRAPIDSASAVIVMELSPMMETLFDNWTLSGSLQADGGTTTTDLLTRPIGVGPINLTFGPSGIDILNMSLALGDTDMSLRGLVSRDSVGMIFANLDITGCMADVSQLQHLVAPASAIAHTPPQPPHHVIHTIAFYLSRPDTLSTLVPSNVNAIINFDYKHWLIGDVALSDIAGRIRMLDGSISLDNTTATTQLGRFTASATYAAPTADSITFAIDSRVSGIELSQLHSFIPLSQYIEPYFADLSGTVDASLQFDGSLTPQMTIDQPSLRGVMLINSPEISFSAPSKLNHLQRWLLFKGDQPDNIHDVSVKISVADRKLTLWPNHLTCDRYSIDLEGIGDFDGDYSFHVGIDHWILPIKFGINIAGNLNGTPHIRLGGDHFHFKPLQADNGHRRFNIFRKADELLHKI